MEIIDFKFGVIINPDKLRNFCRALNGVKVITGISIDSKRIVVDSNIIMNYFNDVKEIMKTIPANFILINIIVRLIDTIQKYLFHANLMTILYINILSRLSQP